MALITRKALAAKLQDMDLSMVLIPGCKRTSNWRGYAAVEALRNLIGIETFAQATHVTRSGNVVQNPKWFKQLFTDLEWSTGDITPGSILQALI